MSMVENNAVPSQDYSGELELTVNNRSSKCEVEVESGQFKAMEGQCHLTTGVVK